MHPGTQRLRCPKGYSAPQINLIGLLLGVGSRITPYEQLARQLGRFYGMNKSGAAVRGLLDRLSGRRSYMGAKLANEARAFAPWLV